MTTIHLLVEDDYIETLMDKLPKDKVTVIEEDFKENKTKLLDTLNQYKEDQNIFSPYLESMKNLNDWLKGKEL